MNKLFGDQYDVVEAQKKKRKSDDYANLTIIVCLSVVAVITLMTVGYFIAESLQP